MLHRVLTRSLAAGLMALAAACTVVTSETSGQSSLTGPIAGQRVALAPAQGTLTGTQAWTNAEAAMATALAEKGVTLVRGGTPPLRARLSMAIGPGEEERELVRRPERGIIGYDTNGTTTVPIYGVVGYYEEWVTTTYYPKQVELVMTDGTGRRVFQARASSRDRCDKLGAVAGPMVRALLRDFPAAPEGRITMTDEGLCL